MKQLFFLINSYFFSSIVGPFFAFIFPGIFIIILGLLLGYPFVFGGLLALPSMTISLILLPIAIFEFKNSILLKRIIVTPIKPITFISVIFIYYLFIMFLSTIVSILFGLAIFSNNFLNGMEIYNQMDIKIIAPSLSDYFINANWFELIWAIIMNILVGSSIGIFVVSFSKSILTIQGITIPILIISQFLSAQVLPISMIKEIDALWYLGYFSPFKYSTGLIIESWSSNPILPEILNTPFYGQVKLSDSSIFNTNNLFYSLNNGSNSSILIFNVYDKILNLIMPFLISLFFSILCLKFFKFSTR